MPSKQTKPGSELLIVDNSDEDWKVVQYLREWTQIAYQFDIATGYFEIGALLALDGQWQKLDQIRILMGDEVSLRTKQAFIAGLQTVTQKLDNSIEAAKENDDFLSGVPAIVEAIQQGKIQARVYRQRKFHAKAFITHAKLAVVGSSALVGSSNFTFPGLHQNVELNIQIRREVEELQTWFEHYWDDAEDVTPDILKTIERHTYEYSPFDVYLRSMAAYFRGHELSVGEWERSGSHIYPILDQYQREGYHALMQIAARYNGALLCDGVGLGKTFIGLMVIERLLFERKRIALFVPKAARADVWEAKLRRHLPEVRGRFSNLAIYNHTDLLRGGDYRELMQEVAEKVDVILIDEAHHFRNIASNRSRELFNMTAGKQLFLLTATPINNSLYDLMHLIEYFSRREPGYFSDAPLGIHTLRGHFRKMEDALQAVVGTRSDVDLDPKAAEQVLANDELFRALVIQRSRAYVRQSLENEGGRRVIFPHRNDPQVVSYSLAKTYGRLLTLVEEAFNNERPLLRLAIYSPLNYYRGRDEAIDAFEQGRQMQIVGLIRTLLLKRFESSAAAFEASCTDLLLKLLYFVELHNPKTAQRWQDQHEALIIRIRRRFQRQGTEDEEELDEDVVPEEYKRKIEKLDDQSYNIAGIVLDTMLDLDVLARFLDELAQFNPADDDKVQSLIMLMQTHPLLSQHKVLIFTEYRDTAVYVQEQLKAAGIEPMAEVDSQSKTSLSSVVRAFSPYYNESDSNTLRQDGLQEIRVLIATDILAEGLNLQDATCIINYDLHWNPVRLMQRIGRVDRRLDPAVEARIVGDNPHTQTVRGTVHLWNFLPPNELNRILSLYERVTHKTLRISKTFGIEGRKLLTPQDDYAALREFNQIYEGTTTNAEEMFLAYQRLQKDYPEQLQAVNNLPHRLFSGMVHHDSRGHALFFCYRLPAKDPLTGEWSEAASFTRWYLYDVASEQIEEEATHIFPSIECTPQTPRSTGAEPTILSAIRRTMDEHITNTYLKRIQAPVGVKAMLLAWMELV